MTQQYTQCKLVKGNSTQTVWIPSEFAIVDKILELKDVEKESNTITMRGKTLQRLDLWENGWQVKEVYLTTDEEHVIPRAPSNWW